MEFQIELSGIFTIGSAIVTITVPNDAAAYMQEPLILDESLLSFGWTGIVIVSVTKYPGCHLLHAAVI